MTAGRPPTPDEPIDVVVVAGGRGRRLGTDKAALRIGGRRQVDVVVDAIGGLGGRIVIAHGPRVLDVVGTVPVPDVADLRGPLAGVVAGLRATTTPLVAVVAVDLVQPDADLLAGLAAHVRPEPTLAGAMPIEDGRVQPLHAVVRRGLATPLLVGGSDRVVSAFTAAGVAAIPEATWRTWSPHAHPSHDVDTPRDLAAARRRTSRPWRPGP